LRALIWDGAHARFVHDVPDPTLMPGTAIVRVLYAGICTTDLQILAGYMGFRGIPGHEMVGVVEDGPDHLRGRRVVAEINFSCGRCPSCLAGRGRHCPSRAVMGILGADGAFADLVRVPTANLHVVPDTVSDSVAVFTEPVAAAYRAEEQTRAFARGRTLVVGAGKLGLLLAQVLAQRGDEVSVMCRSDTARGRVEMLALRAVPMECAPLGADLVVDATGSPEGLAIALEHVRPLGGLLLKSTVAADHHVGLARLVVDEVTLIGSRCGPFEPALAALEAGQIAVEPLLEAVVPLDRGVDALAQAGLPGKGKLLLRP
jgi:threonine dehydrogenase-like Zn-dependent dehydrogenase